MSRTRALIFVILAAGSVAACNDGTAPEPVTLEAVLADAATIESYAGFGARAGGAPMLPTSGSPWTGCAFNPSSQSFVCAPVTHGNTTIARSFQLLDASETPQSAFDPATTAAVKTIVDMSGTMTSEMFTSSILHHSEQTVGGLLTSTRSVDGESTSRYILSSPTMGTDTLSSSTITHLTMPRATAAGQRPYPTGTVSTELSSSGVAGPEMTMTTTFNGTSTATLTMTFAGSTQTCTINLAEPSQGTCFTVGVTTR